MVELQHDMASQVGLDVSGAVKSFKSLTAAVKANTAEWKANEASAKRAGDSEKAQSERIKGLSKDIELQKARLADLKKQQSEVDTTTEKGTKRYYDLQKSITQASSSIEKETSQLDKAKSGMSYYTSGLADLQKGYKQAVAVEQSYIDRLKAEGKTEEANAKQLESYKNSVDHLNKQLTIQQNELAKVASQSGKSSDAYKQQEIRVNKTATSLANARKQMDELAKSTNQSQPSGFLDKLKTKLLGTKKEAQETKTSISDIAKGSAIGTAVTGAISGLGSTLLDTAKKGFELAKAGTEIKESWEHVGAGKKGAEELVGEIGKIRSVSNASGTEITAAQKAIYNATGGNIKQTQALTNEIFAFGKAGGASTEQIIGASGKLTRLFSSAKVNLSKFNMSFKDVPALKDAIQKASGMTKSAFTDALKNGKITGDQLKGYMVKAASESGEAWSKYGETAEGKLAKAKGTWTNFQSAVMKPIATSALDGLSKGLDAITGKNGQLNATGKHLQNITATLAKNVGKGLVNTIEFIAKHTTAVKVFGTTLIGAIAGAKLIQGIATTVRGFQTITTAIKSLTIVQKGLNLVASMNPWILGITAVVAGVTLLYAKCKPFREFVNGLAKSTGKMLGDVGKQLGKFGKSVQKTFSGIVTWVKKHWAGLTIMLGGPIGAAAVLIIKNLKPIKKAISNVINWFKSIPKNVKKFFNSTVSHIGNAWKSIKKSFSSFSKSFSDKWNDLWSGVHKLYKSIFSKISDTWNSWTKSISSGLSSFGRKFKSGWNGLWNGVSSIFSGAWKTIKRIAQNAMNGLIDIVNGGIKAVDSVIHAFGGKEHTISLLGHVKLAKGTTDIFKNLSSPITKPIMATLNDGNDSPATNNKEMLIHADGSAGIIQGRNTQALLMPGDNVVNAKDTALLMSMMDNYHFAGGTIGDFFGSIGNGISNAFNGAVSWVKQTAGNLKKYYDLATKIVSHPIKYVESLFSWTNPKGVAGAMATLGKDAFGKVEDNVKQWWSALWSMASNNLDGGGASSALLKAVEKYGEGKPYVWGATGADSFDCSGLVMYALKKAFGISYPHFSGAQYAQTTHISKSEAKSGDLVFWGDGGSEHVGVYAGGNKYFSAQSPSQGIHMNTLDSVVGYGAPKFGRVKGLSQSTDTDTKATNGLQNFVKNEVGNGFFKFIQKLGSMFGEHMADPAGDGVARWKDTVIKALKANGFSATPFQVQSWLKVIARESNGNPKAINNWDSNAKAGIPSKGLAQVIPPTFDKYKQNSSANIYNGYDNLYAAINYMKHVYGSNSAAFARVAGRAYANGGLSITEKLAHISEGNKPEMLIPLDPLKHNRAVDLLNQTTKIVKGNDSDNDTKKVDETNQLLITIVTLLGSLVDSDKLDRIATLIQTISTNPVSVDTKVNLDGKTLAKQLEKYQVRKSVGRRNSYAF